MLRPATLRETQEMFNHIYAKTNDDFYSDTGHLMLRLHEVLSKCLESLRKERREEIITRLPHIFAWLAAFCNRMEINITDAVWHKFPNVCPYGLEETGCLCIIRETKYQPTLPQLLRYRNDQRNRPESILQFQIMFARIYGPVNRIKSLVAVLCHLAEEVGEIGKDFRLGNRAGLEAEIADTFAWLCGLATHLGVDLEELIWKSYPGACSSCGQEICRAQSAHKED